MTIFDWENKANIDYFDWEILIIFPYRRFALETINQNFSRISFLAAHCHLIISTLNIFM